MYKLSKFKHTITDATLELVNKIAFNNKLGYTSSVDSNTYWDIGNNIGVLTSQLARSIKNRTYEFSPYEKKIRYFKRSKERILYISTWEDKIIEKWIEINLNAFLHNHFSRHSYAYRVRGIGIDLCQNNIGRLITPTSYILRRDISSYFYSIDQDILIEKLSKIVDPNDYLFELILKRIRFEYQEDGEIHQAGLGVPFGSSIACVLANIYLDQVDKEMDNIKNITYFRYADDFLVISEDPDAIAKARDCLTTNVEELNLKFNPKYMTNTRLDGTNYIKFLGLEYNGTSTRLPLEKRRRIVSMVRRALNYSKNKIRGTLDEKTAVAVNIINDAILNRVRNAAIVDYYLKHVNDEGQLKFLDLQIARVAIRAILGKKFRESHFRIIPYKKLRSLGLMSLVHRHRLHRHGHLKVNFLSLYNELRSKRQAEIAERRENRIDQMRMARKLRKLNK